MQHCSRDPVVTGLNLSDFFFVKHTHTHTLSQIRQCFYFGFPSFSSFSSADSTLLSFSHNAALHDPEEAPTSHSLRAAERGPTVPCGGRWGADRPSANARCPLTTMMMATSPQCEEQQPMADDLESPAAVAWILPGLTLLHCGRRASPVFVTASRAHSDSRYFCFFYICPLCFQSNNRPSNHT